MRTRIDSRRTTSLALVITMMASLALPVDVRAGAPADDLKQIEYTYYFRGKYQQTIEALQTFLARVDLAPTDAVRAREFLAASYVLAGAPEMGKEVFTRIITTDPAYAGPDPALFKMEVMNAYAQARSDYAALAVKTAPLTASGPGSPATDTAAAPKGKPVYKQWWFYAGTAAVVALVAGVAAAGGSDPNSTDRPGAGSVAVGVTVH